MPNQQYEVQLISINLIDPDPHQPRQSKGDIDNGLLESIRERGVLEPIMVRPHPDKPNHYVIVFGEQRWRALHRLFETTGNSRFALVNAQIHRCTPEEAFIIALIENFHRQDLNPIEEALAIKEVFKISGNYNRADVAQRLNISKIRVDSAFKLLELPKSIQDLVASGKMTRTMALDLSKLPKNHRNRAVDAILEGADPQSVFKKKPPKDSIAKYLGARTYNDSDPHQILGVLMQSLHEVSHHLSHAFEVFLDCDSAEQLKAWGALSKDQQKQIREEMVLLRSPMARFAKTLFDGVASTAQSQSVQDSQFKRAKTILELMFYEGQPRFFEREKFEELAQEDVEDALKIMALFWESQLSGKPYAPKPSHHGDNLDNLIRKIRDEFDGGVKNFKEFMSSMQAIDQSHTSIFDSAAAHDQAQALNS